MNGETRSDRWGAGEGTIDRLPYFVTGSLLLVIKHGLDAALARFAFGRDWRPFDYFVLPGDSLGVLRMAGADRAFFGVLLAIAQPFIAAGVLLTMARLRSAGLSRGMVFLFFVPLVNLLLFLLLCVLPSRPEENTSAAETEDEPAHADSARGPYMNVAGNYRRWRRVHAVHRRLTRDTTAGSAAVAVTLCVPAALAAIFLGTMVLKNYGWGLFVGGPFCLGLASVVLFGLTSPQPFRACMGVAMSATTLAGIAVLAFALEGAVCLIMAAPIGYFLAFLGALVGYTLQARPWSAEDNPATLLLLLILLPTLMAAEAAAPPELAVVEATTVVEIDAPPEVVWRHVISFPELSPPEERLFRYGIAYPVRAEIEGRGEGAVRRCVFDTGTFVEPIEVWDEPRLLRFRVEDQPEPMREWSPYPIHPPHLHGYLKSLRGQFRLVDLGGGRTRLEGTTWYTNAMWPEAYWRLWSDRIIHTIHQRVLVHIKDLAETQAREGEQSAGRRGS